MSGNKVYESPNHVVDTNAMLKGMRMFDLEGKNSCGEKTKNNLAHQTQWRDQSRGHAFNEVGAIHTVRDPANPKIPDRITGTLKGELARKEDSRNHRFDEFGAGAIVTQRGQSYRGPNSVESPQYHNFARQVNIKRSYPKYRWSESGALLSERREGLPIQWTERSSVAETATSRSTTRTSSRRTDRSTASSTMEELELQKKELLEKRLLEIEEMLKSSRDRDHQAREPDIYNK